MIYNSVNNFDDSKIYFMFQKALVRIFTAAFCLQNKLCEFTAREHKLESYFLYFKRTF